jgi:hypothetical protein
MWAAPRRRAVGRLRGAPQGSSAGGLRRGAPQRSTRARPHRRRLTRARAATSLGTSPRASEPWKRLSRVCTRTFSLGSAEAGGCTCGRMIARRPCSLTGRRTASRRVPPPVARRALPPSSGGGWGGSHMRGGPPIRRFPRRRSSRRTRGGGTIRRHVASSTLGGREACWKRSTRRRMLVRAMTPPAPPTPQEGRHAQHAMESIIRTQAMAKHRRQWTAALLLERHVPPS